MSAVGIKKIFGFKRLLLCISSIFKDNNNDTHGYKKPIVIFSLSLYLTVTVNYRHGGGDMDTAH